MRNDLSFLYGQVQEAGPENVFGGERAKRQDKREAKKEAVSEEPPNVIHKERKMDKKKKWKIFQICASGGAADISVVIRSAGNRLLLWIFKCDGKQEAAFSSFYLANCW